MARVPEVLIVDQDPKARFEVKQLVRQAQLGFAGEAGFGTEGVSLAADTKPDVIIIGVGSSPDRAMQTIEALLDVLPETPVIAYARQEDVGVVRQTMQAGARDFLVIPAEVERLIDSIRSVLESEERKRLRLSGQVKGMGPKGLTVAVFGAKGGVGKTTISVNLALALTSALGQSTALLDGDNAFGDVAAMLELRQDRSVVELIRDIDKVDRSSVTEYMVHHDSGLWVLPAPRESLLWRTVTPELYRRALQVIQRRFDIVLVDTAPTLSDFSLMLLEEANVILWVTSTDFSSINNSLLGFEALQRMNWPENKIRLVLNVTAKDDAVRPARIAEVLKREFFWQFPYDQQVRTGTQVGKPAVAASPESVGAQTFIQLAQALTGAKQIEPAKPAGFNRLFRRKSTTSEVATNAEGS